MGKIIQDLRYGFRMLLKSPIFTTLAVLALALGIGANSAIFSVVNALLLQSLPFNDPAQLARIYVTVPKRGALKHPTSFLNFSDWREQNHVFENIAAYSSSSAALTGTDAPQQIEGTLTSGDFFAVLGTQPALGRAYSRAEETPGSHVTVISHGLWQRRFGADANIVGRQILLDGEPTTVIGVMPDGFLFPLDQTQTDFWSPLNPKDESNTHRGANYLSVIARFKPGATLEQARSEMTAITQRIEEANTDAGSGRGINILSLQEDAVGDIRPALLVLLGAVGCVLLIACTNVANLLLARAASRRKEIAIRTAMGASRWRIVRQLMTESLLLSLSGGALGLVLAAWGLDLLVAAIPSGIPHVHEIGLDANVMAFTLAASVLTGLFFGLAPALQASKPDLNEGLKEGSRGSTEGAGRNRVRSLLVISEVTLSLVLLVGAGLLMRSFLQLRDVKPGFNPHNVLTASVALPALKYGKEDEQATFFQNVLQRVGALPGVRAVAAVDPLPLSGSLAQNIITIEGRPPLAPGDRLATDSRVVSPGYFDAMNIPVIKGRVFSEHDGKEAPKVLVVNETLARKYFPGEDPIGKRISVTIAENMTGEIVGVVGDVKHRGLDKEAGPECYVTYLQVPVPYMTLVARTESNDPASLAAALRGAVAEADKDQPVADVRTMDALLASSVARQRFNT
ncbi:MAG: ABC transporter permease, partial [Pyrinomonadaceae bacterium]